jgi:hypothetical protein
MGRLSAFPMMQKRINDAKNIDEKAFSLPPLMQKKNQ